MTTELEPILQTEPETILRSPEQIAQDIKASHDSVDLINQIVADNQNSDEIHDTVNRNVQHLEQCLMLTRIIDNATAADKESFTTAVVIGNGWINGRYL
jgi:hypothetical protein